MYVELIPRERRERLWRRQCLRRWIAGLGAYGVVAMGVLALLTGRVGSVEPVRARAASLSEETSAERSAELATRAELSRAMSTLQANLAVANQVDWSRLLAIVAEATGEEILLGRCTLRTGAGGPDGSGAESGRFPDSNRLRNRDRTTGIRLGLNGYGRSSQAVSGFVLALEETRLFDHVRLLDTRREPVAGGHAISFRIECVVTGPEEGADS